MSRITARKSLIEEYLFSDNPNFWVIQANSFKKGADLLKQSRLVQRRPARYISASDANDNQQIVKVSCYLYSVSVELFLKAIYVKNKTDKDQEKIESFGHKVTNLYSKLVSMGVFKKNDISADLLESVYIILNWYGRYFRPNKDDINKVINTCFEPVESDPDMLKSKFSTGQNTENNLSELCEYLSRVCGQVNSFLDMLLSTPW